jgi:hypothetical protein
MAAVRAEPSPPARFAAGACGVVAALAAQAPGGFLSAGALICTGLLLTGTSLVSLIRLWWRLFFLLGIAFVGGAAGVDGSGMTLPVLGVVVSTHGVARGIIGLARVALAVAAARVYVWMEEPGAVAEGVSWWVSPLRGLGVDPDRVGEALALTMAYLPPIARRIWTGPRWLLLRPAAFGRVMAEAVATCEATSEESIGRKPSAPHPYSRWAGTLVVALGVMVLAISVVGW